MDLQAVPRLVSLCFICLLYKEKTLSGNIPKMSIINNLRYKNISKSLFQQNHRYHLDFFVSGEKCGNLGQKEGCFELDALYERTLLLNWKSNFKSWDKKQDLKEFTEQLACICAAKAKKKNAAGYALSSWGKCFAVTLNDLNVLNDDDKTTPCYKGDGSYDECDDKDPNTLCVGDDTSAYIYDLVSVDGGFGEWGNWSTCSKTCGSGIRSRERKCDNPKPEMGGDDCVGDRIQKESCMKKFCPVDGGWSEWAGWCSCSKSCNHGKRYRSRGCYKPKPMHGGKPCSGNKTEYGECAVQPCPVDGKYTTWTKWGQCSLTCGGGKKTRQRTCTNPPPKYGGEKCEGPNMDYVICNKKKCKGNTDYSEWSSWSDCSEECGTGERYRKQVCINKKNCKNEEKVEKELCLKVFCPVDGNFGEWTSWTKCNRECGMGNSTRKRFCNSPVPLNGGKKCEGSKSEVKPCIESCCPVDGDWGEWNHWSTCSATCGDEGKKTRMRTCDKPKPRDNGKPCPGSDTELEECKLKDCPKEVGLTKWGSWIKCSKTCGFGRKRRFRQCTLKEGKCKGRLMEQKRCYSKCPDLLKNCSITNKAEFFPNEVTTKRGYVHPKTIPKIGKQYGVSFTFKLNSLKVGVILQVRAQRNGQSRIGRRMPRVELNKDAKLELQIPLNKDFKHVVTFPQKLSTDETYILEMTQIKQGKIYIVSITLTDSKHEKTITMENKAPTEVYKVKIYASPGWREQADATIEKLKIYGICNLKAK